MVFFFVLRSNHLHPKLLEKQSRGILSLKSNASGPSLTRFYLQVDEIYHDESLGTNINIVLVRMIMVGYRQVRLRKSSFIFRFIGDSDERFVFIFWLHFLPFMKCFLKMRVFLHPLCYAT